MPRVMDRRALMGRLVMGGLLAPILGRVSARPAAAQTHKQASNQANNESLECLREGGTPDAHTYPSGTIETTCTYSDGSNEICTWEPATGYRKDCHVDRPLTRPPSTHGPIGGGVATTRLSRAGDAQVKSSSHRRHRRHHR